MARSPDHPRVGVEAVNARAGLAPTGLDSERARPATKVERALPRPQVGKLQQAVLNRCSRVVSRTTGS
jgi:hypothetical protein